MDLLINAGSQNIARCKLADLLPCDIDRDLQYTSTVSRWGNFSSVSRGESSLCNYTVRWDVRKCFSLKSGKQRNSSCLISPIFSGLMMESEKKIFEMMNKKAAMSKYWMPLVWATNIINRARKEALITSDHVVQTLLVELSDIRKRLGALIGYDTVCVPLVYTQVSILTWNRKALRSNALVIFQISL